MKKSGSAFPEVEIPWHDYRQLLLDEHKYDKLAEVAIEKYRQSENFLSFQDDSGTES